MTPKEFRKEIAKLAAEVGSQCAIYASISVDGFSGVAGRAISASLYPRGMTTKSDGYLHVDAEDFPALLNKLRDGWAKYAGDHQKQTIRKMALTIIRITAEQGHCTDAALRAEFDPGEVTRYGADAITDANEIAGNGPFSIIPMVGANAA